MSKFTPGPWTYLRDADGDHAIYGPAGEGLRPRNTPLIAVTYGYTEDLSLEEDEANARLMAAAPELLDAVKNSLKYFYNPGSFIPLGIERMLTAAIRKAEEGA